MGAQVVPNVEGLDSWVVGEGKSGRERMRGKRQGFKVPRKFVGRKPIAAPSGYFRDWRSSHAGNS